MPDCKAYKCKVCPLVFPSITVAGLQSHTEMSRRKLVERLKAAYGRLEEAGVVPVDTSHRISVSSLRRGGNSAAAAEGVRQGLREKHGRWGQAGPRAKTAEPEYDAQLSSERSLVSAALHRQVNKGLKRNVDGALRER